MKQLITVWFDFFPVILNCRLLSPGFLDSLGMMQRTKCGWVLRRFAISLFRFSCIYTKNSFYQFSASFWRTFAHSNEPCVAVKLSGRKLLFSSSVWFEIWTHQLKRQKKCLFIYKQTCYVKVYLATYPCQNGYSSQRVQPSVYWTISGTLQPLSHLEGLCSYPAIRWYCMAPTIKWNGFYFHSP